MGFNRGNRRRRTAAYGRDDGEQLIVQPGFKPYPSVNSDGEPVIVTGETVEKVFDPTRPIADPDGDTLTITLDPKNQKTIECSNHNLVRDETEVDFDAYSCTNPGCAYGVLMPKQ